MLKPFFTTARDIPDAWFQLLRECVINGREYTPKASSTPSKRWELDFTSVHITHPGTRPLAPEIPAGLGIPGPIDEDYAPNNLQYYLTDVSAEGEHYCYDNQTEILTDKGWKLFKDLDRSETVATVSPSGEIVYQKPSDYCEFDYNEDMYFIESDHINLGITKNHKMYISQNTVNRQPAPFSLVQIEDINRSRVRFKKDGKWTGRERSTFIIEPEEYKNNHTPMPIEFAMDDWLGFFGTWLADGTLRRYKDESVKNYNICVTKYEGVDRHRVEALIKRIFPTAKPTKGKDLVVSNKSVYKYLEQFGLSGDKFIPRELLSLSKRQLRILFKAMYVCDGTGRYTDQMTCYSTKSKRLADDVQEVCFKLGMPTNISQDSGIYRVRINQKYEPCVMWKDGVTKRHYTGKVHCVSVLDYHTLYVRREGKPCWCGNTYGQDLAWQVEWCIKHYKEYGPNKHCYMAVGRPEMLYAYDSTVECIEDIRVYERETDAPLWGRQISNMYNRKEPGTSQCLRGVDTAIKDGKLHFSIHFRSWNLWNGLPANLACLQMMKEYMAQEIGVEDGEMFITSLKLGIVESCFDIAKLRTYVERPDV